MTDEELIAEAVAAGRVRKIPCGATSDWDDLPFKEKHSRLLYKDKLLQRRINRQDFTPMPIKLGTKR